MKSRSGFTIIEIVVVVVILGILATIATFGLARLQTDQRDSRRAGSVNLMLTALEKYYDKNGEYPYGEELNPTANNIEMPNYDTVTQLLPDLSKEILTTEDYKFIPRSCPPPSASCAITQPEIDALDTAFLYFTARANDTNGLFVLTKWGCRIDIASTQNPAAAIAWKEEQTGKWRFAKTKRGGITISNYGPGPTSPTVCEFTAPN